MNKHIDIDNYDYYLIEDGVENKISKPNVNSEQTSEGVFVTLDFGYPCKYNSIKQCKDKNYITGKVMYCVPPCYSCDEYIKLKECYL